MSTNDDTTRGVTDETVAEEQRDAQVAHSADRPPTPEEEAAAESSSDLPPGSAEAYKEAIERGAAVEGEGKIGR